jgi:hypothetical protein
MLLSKPCHVPVPSVRAAGFVTRTAGAVPRPSSRRWLQRLRGPYLPHTPGSPSRLRFQALHRFHGLHPDFERLGTPCSCPKAGPLTTPQALRHATDRIVAPPYRASHAGPGPARFPADKPGCGRACCCRPWARAPFGYRLDPDRPRDAAVIRVEPARRCWSCTVRLVPGAAGHLVTDSVT